MTRLKKTLSLLMLSLSLLCTMPMTAFATEGDLQSKTADTSAESGGGTATKSDEDVANTSAATYNEDGQYIIQTGDAITDIMDNQRFQGAIRSINSITAFIDIWFTRIITATAFFIISAAMLKNACAGAYVANHKFWDKVDDAHKMAKELSISSIQSKFQGGQGIMNAKAGSLSNFILCLVPNIKAFTDFDDNEMEPKAYFMKAIPQMCVCIIIGIFIYNGYYRDTAATVGQTGSVIVTRVLGSVNPDAMIDSIFNTTGWPDLPTKNDMSIQGRAEYAIGSSIKTAVASQCKDIKTAQQKAAAISAIASVTRDKFTEVLSEVGSGTGVGELEGKDVDWTTSKVKAVYAATGASREDGLDPADAKGNRYFYIEITKEELEGAGLNSADFESGMGIVVTGYLKQSIVDNPVKGTSETEIKEYQGQELEPITVSISSRSDSRTVTADEVRSAVTATLQSYNVNSAYNLKGPDGWKVSGNGSSGCSSATVGSNAGATGTVKLSGYIYTDKGNYTALIINW